MRGFKELSTLEEIQKKTELRPIAYLCWVFLQQKLKTLSWGLNTNVCFQENRCHYFKAHWPVNRKDWGMGSAIHLSPSFSDMNITGLQNPECQSQKGPWCRLPHFNNVSMKKQAMAKTGCTTPYWKEVGLGSMASSSIAPSGSPGELLIQLTILHVCDSLSPSHFTVEALWRQMLFLLLIFVSPASSMVFVYWKDEWMYL